MRKVIYSKHVKHEGDLLFKLEVQGEALFHQFGINYEEFESGPGQYTTAIIELPDGSVMNVPAEHIEFVNPSD